MIFQAFLPLSTLCLPLPDPVPLRLSAPRQLQEFPSSWKLSARHQAGAEKPPQGTQQTVADLSNCGEIGIVPHLVGAGKCFLFPGSICHLNFCPNSWCLTEEKSQ